MRTPPGPSAGEAIETAGARGVGCATYDLTMSFPTSEFQDGMANLLKARSIADHIRELRPDLAERVTLTEERNIVTVKVTDATRIVCARITDQHVTGWGVVGPDDEVNLQGTPQDAESLASLVVAKYDRIQAS